MDYRFEEVQQYRFVVYDVDDRKHVDDVKKHDLIGAVECTLADLVTAGQLYTRTLRHQGMSCTSSLRRPWMKFFVCLLEVITIATFLIS